MPEEILQITSYNISYKIQQETILPQIENITFGGTHIDKDLTGFSNL